MSIHQGLDKLQLYDELLLKEGKLVHEQSLAQEKLRKIAERRKQIEDAIRELNLYQQGQRFKGLARLDIEIDDLVEPPTSKNKDSYQVTAFFLGFIK